MGEGRRSEGRADLEEELERSEKAVFPEQDRLKNPEAGVRIARNVQKARGHVRKNVRLVESWMRMVFETVTGARQRGIA